MNLAGLAWRNVWRNRFRVILTILGVAVALVGFVLLRTVVDMWELGAQVGVADRIATRNKVSFVTTLPLRYAQVAREIPGVRSVTYANWFGARDPNHEDLFFATLAVDGATMFEVFDDYALDPAQREAWMQDRQGAIIGEKLAQNLNLHIGDRITLRGTIYSGDWEFRVSGIYRALQRSADPTQFFFHWQYMNERIPADRRDRIGWMMMRVTGGNPAEVAQRIDQRFDAEEFQTLSMSEKALNQSFLGAFTTILAAMDWISVIILLILVMILGNTIAMGVRERTQEYGVLRALGFKPGHIVGFIVSEAVLVGLISAALGLLFAYPVIVYGFGRFIEENMGGIFPYFHVTPKTMVLTMLASLGLAGVSAAVPALRVSRLSVVDSLRRLE